MHSLALVMQNIQEIFNRIQENKKKLKDLRSSYKDALSTSQQYIDAKEELTAQREKAKQIEADIRAGFASEFTQMDDLKIDIASDEELLTDIAMTKLMKGESVEITDQYDNEYEPIFNVKFKKTR